MTIRFFPFSQGDGYCAKMTMVNATNVKIRRRGCDNNPVEPVAIQAPANPVTTAITGLVFLVVVTGYSSISCIFF